MKVWELRCGDVEDFAMIVPSLEDAVAFRFQVNGQPLDWMSPPVIEYADSRSRGKKKRPVADVATGGPGSFFLSQKAVEALGPFLSKFGQILPVQTAGGADWRHFYNVTNLVRCVQLSGAEGGGVPVETFYDINVPREPAVFKDPQTAKYRMYVNEPGRELLERLAAEAGLTGLECGDPRDY
jgi:hypothetical protein